MGDTGRISGNNNPGDGGKKLSSDKGKRKASPHSSGSDSNSSTNEQPPEKKAKRSPVSEGLRHLIAAEEHRNSQRGAFSASHTPGESSISQQRPENLAAHYTEMTDESNESEKSFSVLAKHYKDFQTTKETEYKKNQKENKKILDVIRINKYTATTNGESKNNLRALINRINSHFKLYKNNPDKQAFLVMLRDCFTILNRRIDGANHQEEGRAALETLQEMQNDLRNSNSDLSIQVKTDPNIKDLMTELFKELDKLQIDQEILKSADKLDSGISDSNIKFHALNDFYVGEFQKKEKDLSSKNPQNNKKDLTVIRCNDKYDDSKSRLRGLTHVIAWYIRNQHVDETSGKYKFLVMLQRCIANLLNGINGQPQFKKSAKAAAALELFKMMKKDFDDFTTDLYKQVNEDKNELQSNMEKWFNTLDELWTKREDLSENPNKVKKFFSGLNTKYVKYQIKLKDFYNTRNTQDNKKALSDIYNNYQNEIEKGEDPLKDLMRSINEVNTTHNVHHPQKYAFTTAICSYIDDLHKSLHGQFNEVEGRAALKILKHMRDNLLYPTSKLYRLAKIDPTFKSHMMEWFDTLAKLWTKQDSSGEGVRIQA